MSRSAVAWTEADNKLPDITVIKAGLLWLASLVTGGRRKREGGRSSLTGRSTFYR